MEASILMNSDYLTKSFAWPNLSRNLTCGVTMLSFVAGPILKSLPGGLFPERLPPMILTGYVLELAIQFCSCADEAFHRPGVDER